MDYSVLPELAAYPARFNAAVELLDRQAAAGYGDAPMFRFGERAWSWNDMLDEANRIASLLAGELGFVPGNRVMLRSGNHPMLAAAWYAVLKAGGVAVTTMPTLRAREIAYIANKARIQYVISHRALADDVESAAPACADSEANCLFRK